MKTIIFDLGNVFIYVDTNKLTKSLEKISLIESNTFYQKELNKIFCEHNKGVISSKKFYSRIKEILKFKISYNEFKLLWSDIFTPNKELLDYVLNINKDNLTIILASNTDPIHYEYIQKNHELDFIDEEFLSYKEKVIKPEKDFFERLLKKYNICSSGAIFVDDLEENINSAMNLGINSIIHSNNETTINRLNKFLII